MPLGENGIFLTTVLEGGQEVTEKLTVDVIARQR
jgi:hypothetical protein